MNCRFCEKPIHRGRREWLPELIIVAWRHDDGSLFCWDKGCNVATPNYEMASVS